MSDLGDSLQPPCGVCGEKWAGEHSCAGGKPNMTVTLNSTRLSKWCGQSQPHGPHVWAQGPTGWYTDCSGHS